MSDQSIADKLFGDLTKEIYGDLVSQLTAANERIAELESQAKNKIALDDIMYQATGPILSDLKTEIKDLKAQLREWAQEAWEDTHAFNYVLKINDSASRYSIIEKWRKRAGG